MPHVEIKYSDNQVINTEQIFDDIERIINLRDVSAGECKSRAYPCSEYKYSHILITIMLLTKAHRDEKFTVSLSKELEASIKKHLTKSVYFSLNIEYNDSYYTTNMHLIDGDILAGISP